MKKSNFTRVEPTEWNLFIQKCKIIYKLIFSNSFVVIEKVPTIDQNVNKINVVGFNMSLPEVSSLANKAYIESINISFRDVSFATKLIKQFHGCEPLTLSN